MDDLQYLEHKLKQKIVNDVLKKLNEISNISDYRNFKIKIILGR